MLDFAHWWLNDTASRTGSARKTLNIKTLHATLTIFGDSTFLIIQISFNLIHNFLIFILTY